MVLVDSYFRLRDHLSAKPDRSPTARALPHSGRTKFPRSGRPDLAAMVSATR